MKRTRRITVGRIFRIRELTEKYDRELKKAFPEKKIEFTGVYRLGSCHITVNNSDTGWHLAISHPRRYPTWDEIAEARYQLIPDEVTMAMIMPSSDQYVNLHPNCFNLHQIENVDE